MGHPAEHGTPVHLQNELQESEDRFRILAEAAFEGVAITDHGRVLEVNSHFCELFGYTSDEARRMSAPDFHPADEAERVRTMNLTGDERPYRAVCRRKNGTQFIAEIRGKSMPYRGMRVRVTAIRDITAYMEAEAGLRRTQEELERRVQERTAELHRLNAELVEKVKELEQFEQAVVGRELKMMELERRLTKLQRERSGDIAFRTRSDTPR